MVEREMRHPVVIAIANAAATSFAFAAGEILGSRIFDLDEGQNRLAKINLALGNVKKNMENILRPVPQLPQMSLSNIEPRKARSAYITLENKYARFEKPTGDERLSHDEQLELMNAVKIIIDFECCPAKLINLPFWVEFVGYLVPHVGEELKRCMERKLQIHRESLASSEKRLHDYMFSGLSAITTKLYDRALFTGVTTSDQEPYFSYTGVSPFRNPHFFSRGMAIVMKIKNWGEAVAATQQRLEQLRQQMSAERAIYDALYVSSALLDRYVTGLQARLTSDVPIVEEV